MDRRKLASSHKKALVVVNDLNIWFSCKHATTIAAKPHPKSACQLQRWLDGTRFIGYLESRNVETIQVALRL